MDQAPVGEQLGNIGRDRGGGTKFSGRSTDAGHAGNHLRVACDAQDILQLAALEIAPPYESDILRDHPIPVELQIRIDNGD